MRTSPGLERTYKIIDQLGSSSCTVFIAEEHIALRFDRDPDGTIRCNDRTRYDPDAPDRASRYAFEQARMMAIKAMNDVLAEEQVRTRNGEPMVDASNIKECLLSYAGKKYSFVCDIEKALTWENLSLGAVEARGHNKVYLTDIEFQKLKARALGQIQMRRKNMETYGKDGLAPFTPTAQLSLAI